MHILKPIKGEPRIPNTARLESLIKERIEYLAKVHDCSKSFVTNTILADGLGIKIREHYYDYKRVTRKTKRTA